MRYRIPKTEGRIQEIVSIGRFRCQVGARRLVPTPVTLGPRERTTLAQSMEPRACVKIGLLGDSDAPALPLKVGRKPRRLGGSSLFLLHLQLPGLSSIPVQPFSFKCSNIP